MWICQDSTMTGGKKLSGLEKFGIAVGIATIIGTAGTIVGVTNDWFGSSQDTSSPPTTTTSITTTTTSTTTRSPIDEPTDDPWGGTTPPRPTSSAPPIPTQVDQITVYIEPLQGRKVGPTTYAFDGNLDFGLGYGWTGTAGGVAVDGESCQIRMQVTGPETFTAQRTAECSKGVGSPFNGGINSERLTTPGDYTITVTDELTNTVGTATFTLIGR